jgi:hypothetical protein
MQAMNDIKNSSITKPTMQASGGENEKKRKRTLTLLIRKNSSCERNSSKKITAYNKIEYIPASSQNQFHQIKHVSSQIRNSTSFNLFPNSTSEFIEF